MPPLYRSTRVLEHFDGDSDLDLRSLGINLIYIHDWLNLDTATDYFERLAGDKRGLRQHSYIGRFNRRVTPARLTYAHVPSGRAYRFRGQPLTRRPSDAFTRIFEQLVERLPDALIVRPNASVSNGYRYNGRDCIAPHTDDEKFLVRETCRYWNDATVSTVTLLRDSSERMNYFAGDPATGEGVVIAMRHGSLTIQGAVLHEVKPVRGSHPDLVSRISVTLRSLYQSCGHGATCRKPNCAHNLGPSNYLFYSNADALLDMASDHDSDYDIIIEDEIDSATEIILDC